MKIVRRKDIEKQDRPYGRFVQKLLSYNFSKSRDSMALFLSYVPKGKLDTHHHAKTEEIILFPEGGKIEVNGELFSMEPWDLVVLEPGDKHGFSGEDKDVFHLAMR
ncbi:MAG: hypothetical protein U9O94_07260, partial [Nanoarchaeota archaeon]|nr:hypothetical protein [Nanoarchaeota archaeon]